MDDDENVWRASEIIAEWLLFCRLAVVSNIFHTTKSHVGVTNTKIICFPESMTPVSWISKTFIDSTHVRDQNVFIRQPRNNYG